MPVTCRAAVVFAPNTPMEICTVTVADPRPTEVMVRLGATGLCHSDLHVMEGQAPQNFPAIFGHEGFGRVIALGDQVTQFSIGDTVIPYLVPDCGECIYCRSGKTNYCVQMALRRRENYSPFSLDGAPIAAFFGLGTFAEVIVVEQDMLARADPAAAAEKACCIGCGVTTGLGAPLLAAKVEPGSTVAIFGVGGVGLSVVQGAKLAGASRIIAIDTNPDKEDVARKLGATDFVNGREVDDLTARILEITGTGVDYAFECVGSPKLIRQALESTNAAWGVMVNVGMVPLNAELTAGQRTLMHGRAWRGTMMGGAKRADVTRFVKMYLDGQVNLDDLVSHELSLEQINHGFDMMRSGQAVRSVVVFDRAM